MTDDIVSISDILPHRYPFIMIDRVVYVEQGIISRSIKNLTYNETFFQGHFPSNPVMPGVLILEAMAQNCIVCVTGGKPNNVNAYLTSIDKARFRSSVIPGDCLNLESKFLKSKGNLFFFECTATIEEKIVANATVGASVP